MTTYLEEAMYSAMSFQDLEALYSTGNEDDLDSLEQPSFSIASGEPSFMGLENNFYPAENNFFNSFSSPLLSTGEISPFPYLGDIPEQWDLGVDEYNHEIEEACISL
ncbi:hypothetical protein HJFPF1_04681 [Paramyrothecium foliicola]|nr:hypothetical protein HJFPF1_04681 [Paramyrothecium foliicola]